MADEAATLASGTSGVGVGGTGSFTNLCAVKNPRRFQKHELSRIATHVELELPFALKGMTGTYNIGPECVVQVQITQRPPIVAAHNIGLPEVIGDVKNLTLEPDNWGFVNYTVLTVKMSGYKDILPPKGKDAKVHCTTILEAVTSTINPLLDWYSLASENYSIGRVSQRDFVRFEAWHMLGEDGSRCNHTYFYFPASTLTFTAPESEGNLELMNSALGFSKVDPAYDVAFRLFAEANRALVRGDIRLAAIQAISGLEAAVFHYMESRAIEKKDDAEVQRISKKAYDEVEGDLTLSIALRTLLPLLVPDDRVFPKADFDACNLLRKKRNAAIHRPHEFDEKGVKEQLPAVMRVIKFLIANHPNTAEA